MWILCEKRTYSKSIGLLACDLCVLFWKVYIFLLSSLPESILAAAQARLWRVRATITVAHDLPGLLQVLQQARTLPWGSCGTLSIRWRRGVQVDASAVTRSSS